VLLDCEVHLRAARALGVTVSDSVLAQVTEIVE